MSRSILDIPHEIISSNRTLRVNAFELDKILNRTPEKVLSWEPILNAGRNAGIFGNNQIILFKIVLAK